MSKVMIIGCGGVASVAIHKCCQNSEVFSEIMIARDRKSTRLNSSHNVISRMPSSA